MQTITVFAGSAEKVDPEFYSAAQAMGREIASRGLSLVYGAGKTGLMGAVADGALAAGGEVIGVVPGHLNTSRLIHAGLTRLEVTDNMHERKARMYTLADAFIVLPGGYGTMDEMFEAVTWSQLGLHHKPAGLLNVGGFFQPLILWIDQLESHGFIYPEHRHLLISQATPAGLLDALAAFEYPSNIARWVNRDD